MPFPVTSFPVTPFPVTPFPEIPVPVTSFPVIPFPVTPFPALCSFPRTLVDAALVARDTVVCCFENEHMERCLAVWRGWSARDFDIFYQAYEELGRLETCMRKRR